MEVGDIIPQPPHPRATRARPRGIKFPISSFAAVGAIMAALCSFHPETGSAQERPPVRQRLRKAIDVTREIEPKARRGTKDELRGIPQAVLPEDRCEPEQLRLPLKTDVVRYRASRPWTRHYADRLNLRWVKPTKAPMWPGPADAAEMRKLLKDADPAVRCVAAEALATLFIPEDVPRIAALLGDDAEGAPCLGWNRSMSSIWFHASDGKDLVVDILRGWRRRRVKDYARLALHLMTGETFTTESFAAWWKRNSQARHCLWYWQQRMQREIEAAEKAPYLDWTKPMTKEQSAARTKAYKEQLVGGKAAARGAAVQELGALPAEVEAKVRLLTVHRRGRSAEITGPQFVLWNGIGTLRLSSDRLLDLMDRKGLWQDVKWGKGNGGEHYNRMVARLGLAAHRIFTRDDVARLRTVLTREKRSLGWGSRAALQIGISRLLPQADADNPDNPDTRDGTLRAAIRNEREVFTRGWVARELVRIGLPRNWEFLKKQFFAEKISDDPLYLGHSILQELGAKPLTRQKRTALHELVLDDRFKRLWTMSNVTVGEGDMYRMYAMWSIHAHLGKEVISRQLIQAMNIPEQATKRLPELLKILREEFTP